MVAAYPEEIGIQLQRYYHSLSEKDRRRYAGIEALKLGHGGISYMSRLLVRRAGDGRKSSFEVFDNLDDAFLRVIAPHTAGSPMDEQIKWTNLSRPKIAELLAEEGISPVIIFSQYSQGHELFSLLNRPPSPRNIESLQNDIAMSTFNFS
ncbi:hypothetical protein [Leptothoe spongobia]|uniref:Uncharacterized protein n=1 Tax=Leptothoe spongobia TAU-MAC 1115 TaxID=1967444 RepID=A0A947DJ41_9CYAN|nr:hypothetical protein [Leptothoe spongobia TAU-MAC 1115]